MKANAIPLLAIFEKKMRLEIPLFQRQYCWKLEEQWEPLWEDIQRKFAEFLSGRKDGPIHFLGAMVLDQKQTPTTHVEKRLVIDGQQRLTTLQLFLAAFRDFCAEQQCTDLAKECESFTQNKGMMANAEVERFKVWPTQLDRAQFADVLSAGSKENLELKYPLKKRKYARKYDPRPGMVEAYIFFYGKLVEFFLGTETEPALYVDQPLAVRSEECFQALKNALQVVVIDLEQGDDAQVIFETLNARGEPLLPADLVRNYVFLRATRQGEDQERLYQEFWRTFDDPFWATEVRQGRLSRPRSDLFLQHFLASRLATDIPIRHLFVEYKYWIEQDKPYSSVREELAAVNRHGIAFRRMMEPSTADVLYPLSRFLDIFDMSTAYPLLLSLVDSGLKPEHWTELGIILESYILRRGVCGFDHQELQSRVSGSGEVTPERTVQHRSRQKVSL